MYCKYCGRRVSDDAAFCPYCGGRLIDIKEQYENRSTDNDRFAKGSVLISEHSHAKTQQFKPKVDKGTRIIDIVIISLLIIVIVGSIGFFSDDGIGNQTDSKSSITENDSDALALPSNGYVFEGSNMERASELTIKCQSDANCFIKLKNPNGKTVFSFFVRSGQTCKVNVPAQRLQVFFAYGDNWYGIDKAFGENTVYAKDDEILDFSSYTYTYTLYPVTNGNFTETPISGDEF